MKNKPVFYLLLVGLLIIVSVLAACDRTTELDDGESTRPHDLGVGFENCLACHTSILHAGELENLPALHSEYPAQLCSSPSCHPQSSVVEPPVPVVIATHEIVGAYEDCMVCHDFYKRYEPPLNTDHIVRTNDVCFICHEAAEE